MLVKVKRHLLAAFCAEGPMVYQSIFSIMKLSVCLGDSELRLLRRFSAQILERGISTLCRNDNLFRVHPSITQALSENRPVVALESTIITHGMPYPYNLSTAKEVEAIVRAEGATPATVGLLRGRLHVGLSPEELDYLAQSKTSVKVSRRDLPYAISQGLCGGTTVSATMIAAHRAGIPVFVTGGVGGVHRDGENSLDVSADLTELGRTPVAVVSAGVKSILDIGRTLEYLETQGVCVATFGNSKNFPAFFSPQSGFMSPYNVRNAEEAADLIAGTLSLGLQSGLLLAVPIPEEHAAVGEEIEDAIQAALAEARAKCIRGRDVTPFVLQKVNTLTRGKSLQANISLIHNNARVGSHIACALSERMLKKTLPELQFKEGEGNVDSQSKIIVVGGVNVDFIAKGKREKLVLGQTNPGSVHQSFGGVGKNLADSLSRLGQRPLFISAIGTDSHSDAVLNYCQHMNTRGITRLQEQRTATYCAVFTESGELSLGLGDMDIHGQINQHYVSRFEEKLSLASLLCLDGNIPTSTIDYVCSVAKKHAVPVWYEPTDSDKVSKPFLSESWKALTYTSPNLAELCAIIRTLGLPTPTDLPSSMEEVLSSAAALTRPLLDHLHCVVVTLGAKGVLLCGEHSNGTVDLQPRKGTRGQLCAVHYPALAQMAEKIVNVSGAGDSLAGGMIAGMFQGRDTHSCVKMGLLAARLSLASHHPICPTLTSDSVDPDKVQPPQPWPQPTLLWMEG
ncbi:pseudouridine-metabolizing bifunctional protein C1861.05 isoform X2 [Esox lucius]|uniref:pseudouridine-metabolizing bifunctional protein C1861.05 isoform X2 n=1 Tax=Esox lucius TaxID=8010 RepID=UPI00147769D0|nr:pseudouridine-metabolizing bifunctional protein C1861.05 isoform X2 [Esox lucius]